MSAESDELLCLISFKLVKDCQYPRDPMQPAIKKKELYFRQLAAFFNRVPLPRDNELKKKFDMGSNLLLGDPLPLRFQDVPVYETRGPVGRHPDIQGLCMTDCSKPVREPFVM